MRIPVTVTVIVSLLFQAVPSSGQVVRKKRRPPSRPKGGPLLVAQSPKDVIRRKDHSRVRLSLYDHRTVRYVHAYPIGRADVLFAAVPRGFMVKRVITSNRYYQPVSFLQHGRLLTFR